MWLMEGCPNSKLIWLSKPALGLEAGLAFAFGLGSLAGAGTCAGWLLEH